MISTKTLKAMKTPRKTYAIRVNTMIQMPGKKDSWRYPIHSFCAVARKVEDTLVLHLFDRTARNEIVESYRYCICGSEVKLYSLEKRTFSKTFLSSRLSYGYCGFVINAATIADDMAIRENLKDMIEIDEEMSVNDIIRTFDEKLQKDRTRKKLDEKRRAVVELMERIPSIPDSFNETIEEAIEPSSYGFFNKGKEEVICSRCGSTFKYADVPKFKERDKGSCPVCGKSICYISEKRQEHKVETRMAALVQAIGNKRLVVRYFWITNNFRESPVPKRKVEEVTRTVIDFDKGTIEDYEMYWIPGHVDIIDWTPCKGSFYCVDGIHHKFFEGVMHTKELHEELAKAGLDGICGDYEAVNKLEVEYDSVLNQTLYFERIATRPYIEKLLKCKLYSLAKHYFKGEYDIKGELLNLQATSLTGLLKISKFNSLYNNDIIYTPSVAVFKNDGVEMNVLDRDDWYSVDVITCAAPNLRGVTISDELLFEIQKSRFGRILAVADHNGVQNLVLGAFGCGAFKNDPKIVAKAAKAAIEEHNNSFGHGYTSMIKNIEFAVYCTAADTSNYIAFKECFEDQLQEAELDGEIEEGARSFTSDNFEERSNEEDFEYDSADEEISDFEYDPFD